MCARKGLTKTAIFSQDCNNSLLRSLATRRLGWEVILSEITLLGAGIAFVRQFWGFDASAVIIVFFIETSEERKIVKDLKNNEEHQRLGVKQTLLRL